MKKNLDVVMFVNKKCLKASSSIKAKIFETFFWNIYTGLVYFILTTQEFNSQSMGRSD